MKLARDSSLLIAVPAMLVVAGVWWIRSGDSPLDGSTVRFALREGERSDDLNRALPGSGSAEIARNAPPASPTDPGLLEALGPGSKEEGAAPAIWSGVVRARDGTPIKGAIVRFRYRSVERVGDDSFLDAGEWFTLT